MEKFLMSFWFFIIALFILYLWGIIFGQIKYFGLYPGSGGWEDPKDQPQKYIQTGTYAQFIMNWFIQKYHLLDWMNLDNEIQIVLMGSIIASVIGGVFGKYRGWYNLHIRPDYSRYSLKHWEFKVGFLTAWFQALFIFLVFAIVLKSWLLLPMSLIVGFVGSITHSIYFTIENNKKL